MEKLGIPTVTVVTTEFLNLANISMKSFGAADMAFVVVPHPMGGLSQDAILAKANAAFQDVLKGATTWRPTVTELQTAIPLYPAERFKFKGTFSDVDKFFIEKGWADGFPIIPPTVEAVKEMLEGTDRVPNEVIGIIPTRMGAATVEVIAANAVMSGCLPTYMPILIAAVEAIVDESFSLGGVQTTTGHHSPLLIINGPIRKQLNINYAIGILVPGWRADATIGRAIRLIQNNVGGAIPGVTDMTCIGSPSRYTYVFGENEEENPWEPLHVERGYGPSTSTVTVGAAYAPQPVCDHWGEKPEEILAIAADVMGTLSLFHGTKGYRPLVEEALLVLVPEHAAVIAKAGWSKNDIRRFLFENAQVSLSQLKKLRRTISLPKWIDPSKEGMGDIMLPIWDKPERIVVVVAGGPGRHSAFMRSGHANRFITKEIKLPVNWEKLLKKYKGWVAPYSKDFQP